MTRLSLFSWLKENRVLLWNASSLLGTTVVSSGLGFVYWWLAARMFPTTMVGVASTSISAMMFLGAAGILGLDTLLIGELAQSREDAGSLITGALIVSGSVAGVLGVIFAFVAPLLSPELAILAEEPGNVILFALGVSLTALTLVVDQALIGLLRGEIQLGRNVFFAIIKLVVLWAAGLFLSDLHGISIYATWALGNLLSLVVLFGLLTLRRWGKRIIFLPDWQRLRGYGRLSLQHYGLNLSLRLPVLVLPLIATSLLSATTSATFFVAWMVATLAFVVPMHLSTALHAVGSKEPDLLAHKLRMTLRISFLAGLLSSAVLWVGADLILGLFGASYAQHAAWSLRILGIAIFPMIIRFHYVTINRITRQAFRAFKLIISTSVLGVLLAVVGAKLGGLTGLTLGWTIALCVEAVIASPMVYRVAAPRLLIRFPRAVDRPVI